MGCWDTGMEDADREREKGENNLLPARLSPATPVLPPPPPPVPIPVPADVDGTWALGLGRELGAVVLDEDAAAQGAGSRPGKDVLALIESGVVSV